MDGADLIKILQNLDKDAIVTIPSTASGRFEDPDNITEVSSVYEVIDKHGDKSIVLSL